MSKKVIYLVRFTLSDFLFIGVKQSNKINIKYERILLFFLKER